MSSESNIFQALYSYRPRPSRSSGENFLTESFAYVLKRHPDVCRSWLGSVLRGVANSPRLTGEPKVATQVAAPAIGASTTPVYFDMQIRCGRTDGSELTVLFEHKWDSETGRDQLRTYRAIADSMEPKGVLVFIAPTVAQRAEAMDLSDEAILWRDVHAFLASLTDPPDQVREFAEFLFRQGLGPTRPLAVFDMAAFVATNRALPETCQRVVQSLAEPRFAWDFLPERFRKTRDTPGYRYGRVAVEFYEEDWFPGLIAGFLLDGGDHRLTFVEPERGIDLFFSIDARDPRTMLPGAPLQERISVLRTAFPTARVLGQDEVKSRWRKVVIQEPVARLIADVHDEEEQLQAIYRRFLEWCTVLFEGGSMDAAFRRTWPKSR